MPTPELLVCDLGLVEYRDGLALQERLRASRQVDEHGDLLLLLEHSPVYTRGRRSQPDELPMGEAWYVSQGIDVVETDRGGRVTYHGPGQLVGYAIMGIDDVVEHVRTMERALVAALAEEGLEAHVRTDEGPDFTGVWVDDRKIASIGVHVARGVSTHGFAVNVENDLQPFEWIVALRARGRAHDLGLQRAPVARPGHPARLPRDHDGRVRRRVRPGAADRFARGAGDRAATLSVMTEPRRHSTRSRANPGGMDVLEVLGSDVRPFRERKPPWLKVPAPGKPRYRELKQMIDAEGLHTVCQEAACPNVGECWERGTATFMILGDTCTRRCGFCNVKTGKPTWNDPLEPARVARSVARMGLRHAVITAWTATTSRTTARRPSSA